MTTGDYFFPSEAEAADDFRRLREQLLDASTIEYLERIGVAEGWRCLDLGAGGGSISRWLCERVGPDGHVVAVDLDTIFLRELDHPQLELRETDIVDHDFERESYDLVYTRNTLMYIPEREAVLRKMVDAVRPGGAILVEELDSVTAEIDPLSSPDAAESYRRSRRGRNERLAASGVLSIGRRVFGLLRSFGLTDVEAEGRVTPVVGGTPRAEPQRVIVARASQQGAAGEIDPDEIDDLLAHWSNPDFIWWDNLHVDTWGRKPAK